MSGKATAGEKHGQATTCAVCVHGHDLDTLPGSWVVCTPQKKAHPRGYCCTGFRRVTATELDERVSARFGVSVDTPDPVQDLVDLLKDSNMVMVFWVCPAGCNGQVVWNSDKTDATCKVCGRTKSGTSGQATGADVIATGADKGKTEAALHAEVFDPTVSDEEYFRLRGLQLQNIRKAREIGGEKETDQPA